MLRMHSGLITHSNKTPQVLPNNNNNNNNNNNKLHHPCKKKMKTLRPSQLHLQRRCQHFAGFAKDKGLKSLCRAFQKEKCNVHLLHVKYFLNLLQL